MFLVRSKKKNQILKQHTDDLNAFLKDISLSDSADQNIELLEDLFKDDLTFKKRLIVNNANRKYRFYIAFNDGLVDSDIINTSIIKPLILFDDELDKHNLIEDLVTRVIQINETKITSDMKEIVEAITYGDTILFAEFADKALILNSKKFMLRAVEEPETEKVLNGPREGFNESLLNNLSLIKRRLRTNQLKCKPYTFGRQSNTQACICYIEGIVKQEILDELYKRLNKINTDAMLCTNMINEIIRDNPLSPFKSIGLTERPDVVAGKLLEGRVAIIVDGSPSVLTIPYLFIENFQVNEDYYLNFYYVTFARFLRILAFIITITVPAIYIAVVSFHKEMIPTNLFMNIVAERNNVPLPAALEAFLMIIIFDILRETGPRMPTSVGQALSIVGALVIGQAAVEASLISAPMIIVVGITGIANLLVSKLDASVILTRLLLLLCGAVLGLFGVMLGITALCIHILNLESFGIEQIPTHYNLTFQSIKDVFIRAPWTTMRERPGILTNNITRMNNADDQENS